MDIHKSIEDEEVEEEASDSCDEVCLVEVGFQMEEHIKRSFVSMTNNDRHQLRNKFALPKVAVTKTPPLHEPGDGSAMFEEHKGKRQGLGLPPGATAQCSWAPD